MALVKAHKHTFSSHEWPFPFDANTGAVTTKFVMTKERPIVEVLHWEDGDWQFMCNTTDDVDDGMLVCMGCLYEKFPWIAMFKNLKPGFMASFDQELNSWVNEKL